MTFGEGLEGGKWKSRKTLRVGRSGCNLMERISYKYVIDIFGTDPLSLGELGVVYLEKLEKLRYFNLRTGDRILMKFDI